MGLRGPAMTRPGRLESFAARFKDVVISQGYSWSELANRTGYSVASLKTWAYGIRSPRAQAIADVAQILDVSLDYLAFGKDEE